MPMPPTIVVSGTSSGVGKTTIAVGLMRALKDSGLTVQPFKVGPDFLDPMHHKAACGVESVNLDGWMLGRDGCLASFTSACARSGAGVAVVEGVMGLHDGLDGKTDVGSTAEVAKWLGAPVVLVLDAWCLSRSAAAMTHGYSSFDPDVNVAGVIFNRVAGTSHQEWLRQGMSHSKLTAHIRIIGCLPNNSKVQVPERHLGLHMPEHDASSAESSARLALLSEMIRSNVDLEALVKLGSASSSLHVPADKLLSKTAQPCAAATTIVGQPQEDGAHPVRIGVARDAAFCFYYDDNLRLLEEAGATLVNFSPINDTVLPAVDAIYFGGGYPELNAAELECNNSMRAAVADFCRAVRQLLTTAAGRFVLAECGGLMYLSRRLSTTPDEAAGEAPRSHEMCGVLPVCTAMSMRLQMGYCTLSLGRGAAALLDMDVGAGVRSQVFHRSEVVVEDGEPAEKVDEDGNACGWEGVDQHAFHMRIERPGAVASPEGVLCYRATLATYAHLHLGSHPLLAAAIVRAARRSAKVVSLLPSGTEIVSAILGDSPEEVCRRLVGVSDHCDHPPFVRQIRSATASVVSSTGKTAAEVEEEMQRLLREGATSLHVISSELLAQQQPGVILTQESCSSCDASSSSLRACLLAASLDPRIAITLCPRTVDEVLNDVRLVADAIGERDRGLALTQHLAARLSQVSRSVEAAATRRPRVLGLESLVPLVASGQWLPDMRIRAGGVDALGDAPGCAARRLSWEDVERSQADVIVISCCGRTARQATVEVVLHWLQRESLWQLPAMQSTPPRLFVVDHSPFSRPGPRIVRGIELLHALIYADEHAEPPSPIDAQQLLYGEEYVRQTISSAADSAEAKARVLFGAVGEGEPFSAANAAGRRRSEWVQVLAGVSERSAHVAVAGGEEPSIAGNRLLLHGGDVGDLRAAKANPYADVWELDLQALLRQEDAGVDRSGGDEAAASTGHASEDSSGLAWYETGRSGVRVRTGESWRQVARQGVHGEDEVPLPRSNHAATMWGSVLLVFGGWTRNGGTPMNSLELLDTETFCWTHGSALGEPPCPRGNPSLVVGRESGRDIAIVYGGWDGVRRFDSVHILDLQTWTWRTAHPPPDSFVRRFPSGPQGGSEAPSLDNKAFSAEEGQVGPGARTDHSASWWAGGHASHGLDDGAMVVFGGSSDVGLHNDVWLLVPCSEPTTAAAETPRQWLWKRIECGGGLPMARSSHAAVVVGHTMIVAGGQSQEAGCRTLSTVFALDLKAAHWHRIADLPVPLCRHTLTAHRPQGEGINQRSRCLAVWGGWDGEANRNDLFVARLEDAADFNPGLGDSSTKEERSGQVQDYAHAAAAAAHGAKHQTNEAETEPRKTKATWKSTAPLTLRDLKQEAGLCQQLQDLEDLGSSGAGGVIRVLHKTAVERGYLQYEDPATGFSVFTSLFLKKRACCGNMCRHCPHGHRNVPPERKLAAAAAAAAKEQGGQSARRDGITE